MRQGEHQGTQRHHKYSPSQPAGLVPDPTEVTNEGQTEARRDVVGAGDESGLIAVQLKAPLDGCDHCVNEAVDYHPLKERGHTKEEQHPTRGVEDLEDFGRQSPPATKLIQVNGHVLEPSLFIRLWAIKLPRE